MAQRDTCTDSSRSSRAPARESYMTPVPARPITVADNSPADEPDPADFRRGGAGGEAPPRNPNAR